MIGIITRHAISNYGSFLQAYATIKLFEEMNKSAEIINYVPKDEQIDNLLNTYIETGNPFFRKNFITKKIYTILQKNNIYKMEKTFKIYREKYLLMSKFCKNEFELKQISKKYDILCTGSDQVWGKIGLREYDPMYFLEFYNKKQKCISYAASIGKEKISINQKEIFKQFLKKYKYISVRESSAKTILNRMNIDNVSHDLDPTLLMTKDLWIKFANDEQYNINKHYILVYQLHHNKKFEKYVKNIIKKYKMPVYRINVSWYYRFKPGKFIYLPTPKQFINLINNCECLLTDSFHGTAFAISCQKKFIAFLPNKTGTRITSILNLLNLNDRIIEDYENFNLINKDIDYNKVKNILEKEKQQSIERLRHAIDDK